jgi:hypothetical protein
VAGAVLVALAAGALGWFVGVDPGRTVVAALALAALALVARTGEPLEAAWPEPPGRRTRPGLHVVASTQRQLEGARTDVGDRQALTERLARLERTGHHEVAAHVREVVGLRPQRTGRRTSTRPTNPRSHA